MMHAIEKLLSSREKGALSQEPLDDAGLFGFLIKEKVILALDWSGEAEKNEISSFLQHRLREAGSPLQLDADSVYPLLEKTNPERGDHIPYILKHYQKALKKAGFAICQFDRKNDTYYITLATEPVSKALKKAGGDFWNVSPFGSKTGGVLYTVNCSCGSMNIWQLKRSEPGPADDYCQDCGKQLFDKAGNSLFPVTKDYI